MNLSRPLSSMAVLALGLLQAPVAPADDLSAANLPPAIRTIEQKGARIVGSFDAPGGLRGYAAEYQNQGMALYLTPDGEHVLSGHLFDAKGNDLSREPLERLVFAPMAQAMWKRMERSAWIADGRDDAPRVVYVFTDPNCPYCSTFWRQARPWVDSGKVQLRHIMVGILRADSPFKAAALLKTKNPAKALLEHESNPQVSPLKPLATIPGDIQVKLDANQTLMEELGAVATPAIFYQDERGRLQQQQGAPQPEALVNILGKL